jgi:serine-type D-Ala-D-Ala carboxypeptidase (penicillin-binding protein 5/6)
MTFYTAYQLAQQKAISLPDEMVTIDEEAGEMTGTSAELIAGDVISVEQLLYGLMLPSGNDAAVALAKWAGALITPNPEEAPPLGCFIARMNANAKSLEMKQSCFGNPHGLPNFRNSSNPYDLALLIAKCLAIPLFRKVVATQQYSAWITNEGVRKEVLWDNTNKLLRRDGFIGVKTGVTVTAGPCLASCY